MGAARATAASATAAKSGLESQYTVEASKLPPIQSFASAAITEIIGESLPDLIAEVIELQKQVANKVEVVVSAVDVSRDLMMRLAGPARAAAASAFTSLAQKAAGVHERQSADIGFAQKAKAAWNGYVEALSTDAGVMFSPEAS